MYLFKKLIIINDNDYHNQRITEKGGALLSAAL